MAQQLQRLVGSDSSGTTFEAIAALADQEWYTTACLSCSAVQLQSYCRTWCRNSRKRKKLGSVGFLTFADA